MTLHRREFLKVLGGAAAAAGCGPLLGCPPRAKEAPAGTVRLPPRGAPESWIVSTCGACPGGCGIRARVVAGRLVSIAGNPLHPVNRGGLCPLGLAGAHALYHPDRLRGPLVRTGAAGAGELRPATWDEALGRVTARLRELRQGGLAHTVALVDGTSGLSREVAARFLASYGSPNHLSGRPWNDLGPSAALREMQGLEGAAVHDVENAAFVLAFGSGWLEGSASPVRAARAYGIARRGRRAPRVRIVHVEPRLSSSAGHADEWIPLVPGTEGTLALGLMHMVLREGLERRELLEEGSSGFEPLRALVLRDFHPDAVSERTGVPVATIIRVARQFASTRPAVAIGEARSGPGAPSAATALAIHALNAAVGAIHAPGGVLFPPPVPFEPLPAPPSDALAAAGRAAPPILARARPGDDLAALQDCLERGAPPVQLLLAYGADPVTAMGGGDRARSAVRKAPFVVSCASFLDATARLADVVLPDHVPLERWQDEPTCTSRGFPVLGLRQPVVPPRHDTRHAAEVLAQLARGVGGPPAEAFPWRDFVEVVRGAARGVHRSGRGALFDAPEAEAWIVTMETNGWRPSSFGSFDEFWEGLKARGGWWEPVYDFGERGRVLRTPDRRLAFAPLTKALAEDAPRALAAAAAAPGRYPFRLHVYPLLAAFGDSQGPLPWVQDVLGRELGQSWATWVELAPSDAAALGIRDGALVNVESAVASVRARAKVYAGVRPGVAAMPMGPGGAPGGHCRRALAADGGALFAAAPSRGEPVPGEIWVRIRTA